MVIFIIPVYNEEENISKLLYKTSDKMKEMNLNYKIVVINDGSTDNTEKMVEMLKDKIPVEVYSHYPNRGVGEAFRVGFRKALELSKDGDIIVTKEADNTSDLSILDELISKIDEGYDLTLASCYAREGAVVGTTPFRLILSKGANTLLKLLIPVKNINTYSSFYRAYNSAALKEIYGIYGDRLLEEDGFECMVELLIKFSRNGKFKITEVPMVLDGSRRAGKSKMRVLKTAKGFLKVILKEGMLYRKAYLRYALNIGISLLILSVLFAKIPFEQIAATIRHSKMPLFTLSVFVGALSIFVNAFRWQILLRYLGYRYDLRLLSKLVFMALFFNIYLPSGVVGDFVRVAILPKDKNSKEERNVHLSRITASVITDKVVGMMGLMLLAFIGFLFCYQLLLSAKILPIFGVMAFIIIVTFLVLFSSGMQTSLKRMFAFSLKILFPIKEALKGVLDALFVYRKNFSVFGKVIPLSIVANMCVVVYFFLLSRSIGVDIGFLRLLALVPVIEFIAAIPISFGGVGIRECATILLFSSEGILAAEAMSISLLSFAVIMLLGALGGMLFLGFRNKIR